MKQQKLIFLMMFLGFTSAISCETYAQMVLSDTTFSVSDWSVEVLDQSPEVAVLPQWSGPVERGVDHASVLFLLTNWSQSVADGGWYQLALVYEGGSYLSSRDGAIDTVSYSVGHDRPPSATFPHLFRFLLIQDDIAYAYNGAEHRDASADGVFTTFGRAGITADQFDEVIVNHVLEFDRESHPDFGTDASQINAGLLLRSDLINGLVSDFQHRDDFDDFIVTFTAVPEPTSIVTLLLGGGLVMLRHHHHALGGGR